MNTGRQILTAVLQKLYILILISAVYNNANAQTDWQLRKNEEGIKVYVGNSPNSSIKMVKVECIIDATVDQLNAILLDAKAHEQWVYGTKTSYVVKKINSHELIYYSELSMPWPVKNRDVVVHLKLKQLPGGALEVRAVAVDGFVPQKDLVRITNSDVAWKVTPVAANQLKIEYTAMAEPGGYVPAWVVNMFSTQGPFETFKKLRKAITAPVYKG